MVDTAKQARIVSMQQHKLATSDNLAGQLGGDKVSQEVTQGSN